MCCHHDCWYKDTDCAFERSFQHSLPMTRTQCHAVGIQDDRRLPQNTDNGTSDTHTEPNKEFDLDITENTSIPIVFQVVLGPYQSIDEVL